MVDNRSRLPTRALLLALFAIGRINRLCLLDRNTFFAEANNVGVAAMSREAQLVLLLNSDIEIRDGSWLRRLIEMHERGAISYGLVETGPCLRADGYCFLIDRDLYLTYGLDETLQWWWSVTKLQARLLRDEYMVQAVREHDDLVVHFGGKSGTAFVGASGMNTDEAEIAAWFDDHAVVVHDRVGVNTG